MDTINRNAVKLVYRSFLFVLPFLFLLAHAGQAEIVVTLESPIPDQKVSGLGVISGWAFSSAPDAQVTVRLFVNDTEVGTIPCCVERADVAEQFGAQALTSGFGQVFNFNLLPSESSTIAVEVSDTAGSPPQRQEAEVTVVKPGGFEFLSQLELLFSDNIEFRNDRKEILIEGVTVTDKETSAVQEVSLHLAWQENTQTLGIIQSENTGEEPTESQSALRRERGRAQTEDDSPAIEMTLENPPDQGTASGIGVVSGWAFSTTPEATITSVQQRVDGNPSISIPCCAERADVQQAFPEQPRALQSGFGAPINFNLLEGGAHTIGVEVQDSTGASEIVEHQTTVVKLGNFEFLDQFDLSEAIAFISGFDLELQDVKIRDKVSQQTTEVDVRYAWEESCQCFVAQASCGNGNVEPGEECDGAAFAGATCTSLEFSGGTLGCTETCELDTSACTGGPQVYVTNVVSNSVSVVSAATNTVTTTIPVGKEPRGIAVSPDATATYVTNAKDDTVSVIDTTTNMVTATIPVGRGPQGLTFAPDGTKAYVVNGFDNSVSVINTATQEVDTTLPVGREPQAIAVTPDGLWAYVTNFADNSVTVLNLRTNSAETTIPVGEGPDGIAVRPPDGSAVYAVNFNDDSVSIIDTATNTVTDTILVSFLPVKVAFSPDGTRAFVTNSLDYSVVVIDTAVPEVLTGIFVGVDLYNDVLNEPDGIAMTLNGKRGYVAIYGRNGAGNTLRVFSSVTNNIVASATLEQGPFAVAVTPPPQP